MTWHAISDYSLGSGLNTYQTVCLNSGPLEVPLNSEKDQHHPYRAQQTQRTRLSGTLSRALLSCRRPDKHANYCWLIRQTVTKVWVNTRDSIKTKGGTKAIAGTYW